MRAWIEVEADGDDAAFGATVAGAVDALLGLLVDDPAVVDPAVTLTMGVPDPAEVILGVSSVVELDAPADWGADG